MAQPVYSSKFVSLRNFSGSVSYPVGSSVLWVVRDANFYFGSNGVANPLISDENGAVFIRPELGDPILTSWYGWTGRTVIPSGGHLGVYSDVGVDITISGYVLNVP